MTNEFKIDDTVKSNRDGVIVKKDTVGIVHDVVCVDSDYYLYVRLPGGLLIGPTATSYWDVVPKTADADVSSIPNSVLAQIAGVESASNSDAQRTYIIPEAAVDKLVNDGKMVYPRGQQPSYIPWDELGDYQSC